jgi:CRP-like cAMP-binding protein
MSRRLRKASSIIGNLSLLDVFGRVARTIVDLAEQEGVSTDEGIFVAKRPTQQELASMVGTTRETVSRVLSELNRRGLVTMSGRSITLSHGFTQSDLSDLRAK